MYRDYRDAKIAELESQITKLKRTQTLPKVNHRSPCRKKITFFKMKKNDLYYKALSALSEELQNLQKELETKDPSLYLSGKILGFSNAMNIVSKIGLEQETDNE